MEPTLRRLILCLLPLFFVTSVFAKDMTPIIEMVHQSMPGAHLGVMVQDMDRGTWLYRYHSYEYFEPASVNKLFVVSAALKGLGPDWRYKTEVLVRDGQLRRGVLNGNLVIRFSGDPTFTEEDLHRLVVDVKDAGVRQVKGRVLIDGHRFTEPTYPPGWTMDSLWQGYSAPVTAVMLDENEIPMTVRPNSTLGKVIRVQMNPYQRGYLSAVHAKTVTAKQADLHCALTVDGDVHNHYAVNGCWPIDVPKATLNVAIRHPEAYMKDRLLANFKAAGVKVGKIEMLRKPIKLKAYQSIATYESPPLRQIVAPLLKDSDNLYAESLLKTLGQQLGGNGSTQEGLVQESMVLRKQLDMRFKHHTIADGSGVSRYNRVTPHMLARLLYVMYHDQAVYSDFSRALPIAGYDGTLKDRMTSFDVKERVWAKSGTLKHVSSLAGYMTTRQGHHLAFVILINGVIGPVRPARDVQNQICQYLMQF